MKALLLLVFVLLTSCRFVPTASNIKILGHETEGKIYSDAQQKADWGQRVKVLLRNDGPAARITISAILACSQGKWKKQATTSLESNEAGTVYLDFPEPDFGASDILVAKVTVENVE